MGRIELTKTEKDIHEQIKCLKHRKAELESIENSKTGNGCYIVEICQLSGEIHALYWVLSPKTNILSSYDIRKKKEILSK